MLGSTHNDPFVIRSGRVETETNRHGGALGGITTGMPILCRVAFKPTPSIAREQRSVNLDAMEEVPVAISGRHDPCIVPRAMPVVEAALALAIADLMLEGV
jgi:chorismate synthase